MHTKSGAGGLYSSFDLLGISIGEDKDPTDSSVFTRDESLLKLFELGTRAKAGIEAVLPALLLQDLEI